MPKILKLIRRSSKKILICLIIGIVSGSVSTAFLLALNSITQWRLTYPQFIWGLPLVGLLIPWLYRRWGRSTERGIGWVLEEIHNPNQVIPFAMAPLIFISTLLSHLVGASVGREGTVLQMAASLSDRIATFFKLPTTDRLWALMAALSAGFAAALGAPWAGWIFGLEVITRGQIDRRTILECGVASFTAWGIAVALHAPHFASPPLTPPPLTGIFVIHILCLALFIGTFARAYIVTIKGGEYLTSKISRSYRTMWGGILILGLYSYFNLHSYQGLGLSSIKQMLHKPIDFNVPFIKAGLTILALTVGFKGGEFVPLVFIGTSLASSLSRYWNEPLPFFSALGFVTLFGAAAKTPLTTTLLTAEIFGWATLPYAFIVSFGAHLISGPTGIYPGQRGRSP